MMLTLTDIGIEQRKSSVLTERFIDASITAGRVTAQLHLDADDLEQVSSLLIAPSAMPDEQIASLWLPLCVDRIHEHPEVESVFSFDDPVFFKSGWNESFVSEALKLATESALISANQAQLLLEIWERNPTDHIGFLERVPQISEHTSYIANILYHKRLTKVALDHTLIDDAQCLELLKILSAVPASKGSIPYLKEQFDSVQPNLYRKVSNIADNKYINIGGESVNVVSKEATLASLSQIAKGQKYLKPGFEYARLADASFITIDRLRLSPNPVIEVDFIMEITSCSIGLSTGKLLKTYSLFPGEKAVLTFETFTSQKSETSLTESILDSSSEKAEQMFEGEVNSSASSFGEQSVQTKTSLGASGGASWGFVSAKASANMEKATASIARQTASNAKRALQKQNEAISKNRKISVETSETESVEISSTNKIVRTIENHSVSRPLNFIFYQINEQFLSVFSISGLRIFVKGTPWAKGFRVNFDDLANFFEDYLFYPSQANSTLVRKYQDRILGAINGAQQQAIDHHGLNNPNLVVSVGDVKKQNDAVKRDVSVKTLLDVLSSRGELRLGNDPGARTSNETESRSVFVQGPILDISISQLPTDGVYVENFLSEIDGLDAYARGRQDAEVRRVVATNLHLEVQTDAIRRALAIVDAVDEIDKKAELYERIVVPLLSKQKDD